MEKQIVSLILALMLSFSYTDKMFAGTTNGFGTKTSPESVLEEEKFKPSQDASSKAGDAYSDDALKYLIGQITAVYKFSGGQLNSIVGADGMVRIYFDGKEKGTVKKLDDEGGTYQWTSLNLDEIDVQAYTQYQRSYPNANFGDYLMAAFGIDEDTAAKIATVTNNNQNVVEFLTAGFKSGQGAEVALSLGDTAQSTSLTFSSPPSKRLRTIDYSGNTTGEWVYGNGTSVPTQYIRVGESEESGTSVTVTEMSDGTDKYKDERGNIIPAGQPAYTWKSTISSTTFSSSSLKNSVANVKESDKTRTTTYLYDPKTKQKISETDLTTGEMVIYSNNKPIEVYYKPADGSTAPNLKQRINYGLNGNMVSVIEYTDGKGDEHKQTKISVYADDGRFIASGIDQDEKTLRDQARKIDEVINQSGVTAEEIEKVFAENRNVTNFQYSYVQLMKNPELFKVVFCRKDTETDMSEQFEQYKREHPNATIEQIVNALASEESKDTSLEDSQKVWGSLKSIYDALLQYRSDFSVGVHTEDIENPAADTNITSTTTYKDLRDEGKVEGREHMGDTHDGQSVDRSKGLDQSPLSPEDLADEASGKGQYKAEVTTTTEYDRQINTTATFSINVKLSDDNRVNYENTHILGSKTEHKVETSTETKYYDPAVIGQIQGYELVDADGKPLTDEQKAAFVGEDGKIDIEAAKKAGVSVYAKLSPESINMYDGAGFKDIVNPKPGEEIYVKIEDQDMFDAFQGAENGKVMVTGVVTNGIDGKMCLEVYSKTNEAGAEIGFDLSSTGGKGYATTQEALDNMKAEIEDLATKEGSWVSKNTESNQKIFQAAGITNSEGYLDDWKTGWNELAKLAGGGK
jgi:hypothetical protein